MNWFSRILVLIISLSLIVSFYVPIWKIDLEAPQYPEGLGMKIWIDKLSGDINTINGLNHYIGMQVIEENSIPELKYMPYLLGFIIAFGVLTSLTKMKGLLYTWVTMFVLLGVAGGIDFYLWEYDYGHNLDPRAAIKVEGMAYQPPLLGSKQLLNFVAHSYPDIGGFIIISACALSVCLMVYNLLQKKKLNIQILHTAKMGKSLATSLSSILILLISLGCIACEPKPEPINYGTDHCEFCKMGISDDRFGAELVTDKGKVFKFDALECMINYAAMNDRLKSGTMKLVANAAQKKTLIDAASAFYLKSENFPSPMGSNISAYATEEELKNFQKEFSGQRLTWEEVKQILKK